MTHPLTPPAAGHRPAWTLAALLALVALADALLWQVGWPRMGFAVLALALGAGATALCMPLPRRAVLIGWAGLLAATLPMIEEIQALSLVFLALGLAHLAACLVWAGQGPGAVALRALIRLPLAAPVQLGTDLVAGARLLAQAPGAAPALLRALRDWVLALVLGGVFLALLAAANPLVEGWLTGLTGWLPDWLSAWQGDPARAVFWVFMAALIWPMLRLTVLRPRLTRARPPAVAAAATPTPALPGWLNARAVVRALGLFNLLFAAQTVLDLTYLWGGVTLPDGMTHATYAHRGAYPLLATALLAGAFALVAQPFMAGRPVLRGLLLAWVVQNVLLAVSAVLRLDLYIEVYGLTRLRFAALVWMGLVAAGLAMMLWGLVRARPPLWLAARSAALGLATLYASTFVNVDGLIARTNLALPKPDATYLCGLSGGALPAIAAHDAASGRSLCDQEWDRPEVDPPADWREWGYRNHRLLRSLYSGSAPADPEPDPVTDTGPDHAAAPATDINAAAVPVPDPGPGADPDPGPGAVPAPAADTAPAADPDPTPAAQDATPAPPPPDGAPESETTP